VLDALWQGLVLTVTFKGILMLVIGVVVGLIFGVIPGLGGPNALALCIPLTYGMAPQDAMALAGGIMGAVSFGGSITAILINTPGTAPSAATCFDGYPMARQGRAGAAIGAAGTASSIGGVLGILLLLAVIPLAKVIVLSFGPPEFFMLAMLGLACIAVSTGGMFLRGLVAGGFGLMLSLVGVDLVNGGTRFTAGIGALYDGIGVVPALIGLFALAEMIQLSVAGGQVARKDATAEIAGVMDGVTETFRQWPTVLRGSAIGAVVGAIPGVGGTICSFLAYTAAQQASKDPESFGKGNILGVIAPEASNNAKDGGHLIPTLAFGIPAGAEMVVFLGLMILHGLEPGPRLLIEHEDIIFALIVSLTIACIVATVLGLMITRWLAVITMIDVHILVPTVTAISLVGAYALESRLSDVAICVVFGIVGYVMIKYRYPRVTMILALVLGDLAERSYYQSIHIGDGTAAIFFERSISLTLFILIVAAFLLPVVRYLRARAKAAPA
jgi:putative tricarboxylic transport membrane protein